MVLCRVGVSRLLLCTRCLQILEVIIIDRKTLEGLIDQIFDKALTETSFCEMYAQVRGGGRGRAAVVGGVEGHVLRIREGLGRGRGRFLVIVVSF